MLSDHLPVHATHMSIVRIGWAEPPVPLPDASRHTLLDTVRFATGTLVHALVPFASLWLMRSAFRTARVLTPRPLRCLGGRVARAIAGDRRRWREAWRAAFLVHRRRTQAGIWLANLLVAGRVLAYAARRAQRGEVPAWIGIGASALRSLRLALRDDVLIVDRDARLPAITHAHTARAYAAWCALSTILDPPSLLASSSAPAIRLVARWTGRDVELAQEMLEDLAGQSYSVFELDLVVDSEATPPPVELCTRHAAFLRVAPPSDTLETAFMASRGDFVGAIDLCDRLAPHAIHELACALINDPTADVVYGDEDWLGDHGPFLPHLKGEFAPDTQRSTGYIGRPWLVRRTLLVDVGGLRVSEWGLAAEYDLMLRLMERRARFAHAPRVLYRWRVAQRPVRDDAPFLRALDAHLARTGGGTAEPGLVPATFRPRPALAVRPLVSVVIPSHDQPTRLAACLESLKKSTYARTEIVIVENGSTAPAVFDLYRALERDGRGRVVPVSLAAFNFSTLVNRGVERSLGDVVVLLNNDTEVVAPGWIEAMLEHAMRPEIGAVGARLLYPDGTVQHCGVVLGPGGLGGHLHRGQPGHSPGYARRLAAVQNLSAATAACLMVRRTTWDAVSGMDERLPVAYNDVDFCLRLRSRGLMVVVTPFAELLHHEHGTRGRVDSVAERDMDERGRELISRRWRSHLANDPYLPRDLAVAWLLCGGR